MNEPVSKSRIGCRVQAFHQQPNAPPAVADPAWGRFVESDEQPWVRQLTVGPEWQALDCGWVERAGLMVLQNTEGKFPQVIPTEEERAAVAARVVELAYKPCPAFATWVVRPGAAHVGEPGDVKLLRVRCRSGTARCTLYLFPA